MSDNHDISWHSETAEQAVHTLKSSTDGLSDEEARSRLEKYGRNELRKKKTIGKKPAFKHRICFFNRKWP